MKSLPRPWYFENETLEEALVITDRRPEVARPMATDRLVDAADWGLCKVGRIVMIQEFVPTQLLPGVCVMDVTVRSPQAALMW